MSRDPSGRGLPPQLEALIRSVLEQASLPPATRSEVEAELRAHFEDGLESGRSPAELLDAFGDPDRAARWIGQSRGDRSVDRGGMQPTSVGARQRTRIGWSGLGREMKHAFGALRRSPGFAIAAVLTLAVGIGANAAVFSVLDAVLLAPLPYPEANRLVRAYEYNAATGNPNFLRTPAIVEWREWDDVFESFGTLYTYSDIGADLTGGDRHQRVTVSTVDADFFPTLGAVPFLGRAFRRSDESDAPFESGNMRAGSRRAILSEGLWRTAWGGDPDIVGRTVQLDGLSFEVVGVLPAGFENPFGAQPDLWVPQDMTAESRWNNWGNFWLSGVARLAEGVPLEQAQERFRSRHEQLADLAGYTTEQWKEWAPGLEPLRADLVGETRSTLLWFLFAAVGLVLLSACVNVANLFLVRSLGRTQELAVRASLGSTRARLVAHMLWEAGILAVLGAVTGLGLGWVGVNVLAGVAPDALPSFSDPGLNGRVIVFTMAVTATTVLIFGLLPALRASRTGVGRALRQGARETEDGGTARFRDGLVVAEVAVALTLVIGAGLLARSFGALQETRLGVEPEDVLTFEVHLPDARYASGEEREALYASLQREAETVPEIASIGAVSWLPVNGPYNTWGLSWTDQPIFPWEEGGSGVDSEATDVLTDIRIFRGDYFGAMGIDVVLGETPDPRLSAGGDPVVWINREIVRQLFEPLGVDPVGKIVWVAGERRRVAGVVEDIPLDLRGTEAAQTFIPHAQFADDRNWALIQTAKLRPGTSVEAVERSLVERLRRLDAVLVLFRARPFERILAEGIARDRFAALLMTVLAGLALALATIGTYGVLAYSVGLRRKEIGIRMALGAEPAAVGGMVLGHGVRLLCLGIALGLVGAWGVGRWIESLLYGIDAMDPTAWSLGPAALLLAGVAAAVIPVARSARVDPARTLAAD